MSQFNLLQVKDVIKETVDAVSFSFDVPSELQKEYSFKPGQYLTLKFNLNGEELRRSYSICSSRNENELRVAVKKIKDGKVSAHIVDTIKQGDKVEVMIPMGNFYTETNPLNKKKYILFAGGSGITPLFSILKTVLTEEPGSTVILFYGNNDEPSIIFKKQLDTLVAAYPQRLIVKHILATVPAQHPLELTGMLTKEKDLELINRYVQSQHENEYFICGPGAMMENAIAVLKELKVEEQKIHVEYFIAPVSSKPSSTVTEGAAATIIINGDKHNIVLNENETVLEAALRSGLDAPYACQGGSCCTCRAFLEEGKVEMAVNYALSQSEVKQGYILTCQSRPVTTAVIVNYDRA